MPVLPGFYMKATLAFNGLRNLVTSETGSSIPFNLVFSKMGKKFPGFFLGTSKNWVASGITKIFSGALERSTKPFPVL